MINNLHHFEILTSSSSKLLNYLINGFKFKLVCQKQTDKYNQYLINSNTMNFLITSINKNPNKSEYQENNSYETSLKLIESKDKNLFNLIKLKNDTVFNAALQVRDLDRILFNCNRHNVEIIKNKHILKDDYFSTNGFVQCAVIKSCIEGLTHTLLDLSNYNGKFLPGFESVKNDENQTEVIKDENKSLATHFDHLTYATYKNTSNNVIDWYSKVFNMKRFKINREELNGLLVRTGESGMNIKAIHYWLCAETGCKINSNENDFKFVVSEPIDDDDNKSKNQISIFLEEHNGPGIQHIGLHTPNIVKSVKMTKKNIRDVKYYITPDSYYEMPEKIKEIKDCGMNCEELKENHILLDAEIEDKDKMTKNDKSFLLQVFTQPLFEKKTLFLELIQRVGQAQGFGAANIKALWNAVQYELNKSSNKNS